MKTPTPTPEQAVLILKLQAERLRPKFSRNLANFVKHRVATKVYRVTPKADCPSWERSSYDRDGKAMKGRVNAGAIYISDREDPWSDSYFHGTSLNSVTTTGGAARVYATAWKRKDWDVEDITEWFWARYAEIGKCLWDWKHTDYGFVSRTWTASGPSDQDERFTSLDDQTCKCKWCGDVLHLRRTVAVEIRVRHKWTHAKVRGNDKTFRCLRCHRPHPIADLNQEMRGYGPILGEGIHGPRRKEITLKKEGYCPKCFLTVTMAHPTERQALLPSELLVPLKINT